MTMPAGSGPSLAPHSSLRPLVRRWFEAHWVPTDGSFSRRKSAHDKQHATVTDMRAPYHHFIRHALGASDPVPDLYAFACTLQRMFGVRILCLTNNPWVGTVKRAVAVRPRGAHEGCPLAGRGEEVVAPAAFVGAGLFEEFRRVPPS